jgi:glucan phosphoethanolaminetransferase (alkaline phosphatase superfamily)
MAKIGVCCLFCCNRDYHQAVKEMLINTIVAAVLTINWILWTSIFVPPNFKVAMSVVGFVFKAIIFCIQIFVLYATTSLFVKHKKDYVTPRKEVFTYGKVSLFLVIAKLFCLVGLLCLTSIGISHAAMSPEGVKKLGVFFLIARIVLAGCFALEIWGGYMMAKLMEISRDDVYDKTIPPGDSINMAQNVEKKELKSNSHADLNNLENGKRGIGGNDHTKTNNMVLDDSQGMSNTGSEKIVNNEFRQIEVNHNE